MGGRGAGEMVAGDAAPTSPPLPSFGLDEDYPELWSRAHFYDYASLIGVTLEPIDRQIDGAMRELWLWRRRLERERGPTRGRFKR